MTDGVSTHNVWHEAVPGRWRRPLVGMESLVAKLGTMTASLGSGREHFTICSYIKLKLSLQLPVSTTSAEEEKLDDILREAWVRLRFQQPNLACTADM